MQFEDLKGAAKDCFDKAVKKGIELSDRANIMFDRNKLKREIDELYKGIGTDYYNSVKYEADLSGEINLKISKIDELKIKISELDLEEEKVRSHKCYNCNSKISRDDLICPVCKAEVSR